MATTKKAATLAEIIKQSTPAEKVVSLCVAGGLVAEHQRLEAEREKAQLAQVSRSGSAKLSNAGDDDASDSPARIAKKLRALEARMRDYTHDFVFRKHDHWQDLKDEHPPRKGKENRELLNPVTFAPAAVQACCVSPDLSDDEAFNEFWSGLNQGQRDALLDGAWSVNEDGVSVPFSVSASVALSSSKPSSTT
jgi:hypothetical protein